MTSEYNLDRLNHKGVRTKDGNDLGNIIANDGVNITVQGRRIYKVPAQFIDFFNGSEVFLNKTIDELPK